jgi:RNA polymerase sigma factor (TIGR02999 family)
MLDRGCRGSTAPRPAPGRAPAKIEPVDPSAGDARGAGCDAGGVTALLRAAEAGDQAARDRLFTLLYDELKRLARHQLRHAPARSTLNTTGLVHETYLRLSADAHWTTRDRSHFFAMAARAMRNVLVDQARRRSRQKRGGFQAPLALDEEGVATPPPDAQLLALDAALSRLDADNPELARVVEWRFFGGFSVEEIAAALEVSDRTVKRQWRAARAFLHHQLGAEAPSP